MMAPGSRRAPDGITVDDVDWLPSGARSGIVRVQGRRSPESVVALPVLLVGHDGRTHRFESLPDTAAAGPEGWRGAYVVEAALALAAQDLRLQWPGGEQEGLGALGTPAPPPPRLEVVPSPPQPDPEPAPPVAPAAPPATGPGGELVDRAEVAERRAGRAEVALEREARSAQDALAAVEALELRSAALAQELTAARAERDALRARIEPGAPAGPSPQESALQRALAERDRELGALRDALDRRPAEPVVDEATERRAAALEQALTEAVAEADALRADLQEQLLLRRTRDLAANADRVALGELARDLKRLRDAVDAARADAARLSAERDEARVEVERQRAAIAGETAAHEETRRRLRDAVAELRGARERIAALEGTLTGLRLDAQQAAAGHEQELIAQREAAERAALVAAERLAAAEARAATAEARAADAGTLQEELDRARVALRRAETAREAALASALAARAQRRVEAVRDAPVDPARVAALEAEVVTLRARLAVVPPPPVEPATPAPVAAPAELIARAAEQVRAAAAHRAATSDASRVVVADLDAAAAVLRARAADPPPENVGPALAPPAPPVAEPMVSEPDDESLAAEPTAPGPGIADVLPDIPPEEPAPVPRAESAAAEDAPDVVVAERQPLEDAPEAAAIDPEPVEDGADAAVADPEPVEEDPPAATVDQPPVVAEAPDVVVADPEPVEDGADAVAADATPDPPEVRSQAVADPPAATVAEPPASEDSPDEAVAEPWPAEDPVDEVAAEPWPVEDAADAVVVDPPPAEDVPAEPPGGEPDADADVQTAGPTGVAGATAESAGEAQAFLPEPLAADEPRRRRRLEPVRGELPGSLARPGAGRSYPPLRGGLVKLAHDDPQAAARLLAGLAHGLHAVVGDEVRLDLLLTELDDVLALNTDATAQTTTVQRLAEPRARRAAPVQVRTDAVTLTESLAGVGPQPRRRGPLRARRGRRVARALAQQLTRSVPLPTLVAAGARLDPALALRAFAYAIPPAWTRGSAFTVAVSVGDAMTVLRVRDGRGVDANGLSGEPDLRLELSPEDFDALLRGAGGRLLRDPRMVALRGWAVALGAIPS